MGSKAKHDYMPALRRAYWEGLVKTCRERGILISDFMAEQWKADPQAMLTKMAQAAPREAHVTGNVQFNHDHNHTYAPVSESASWIAGIVGEGEDRPSEEPVPDGSLLPPPLRSQ